MDEIRKAFGKRLRHLRVQAGLTQEMFAEAVEMSAEAISNIERGRHAPGFSRLFRFAKVLGVPIHELFRFSIGDESPRGRHR